MSFETVPLNSSHNKKDFSCGKEMLDNYIQKQAKQDQKRKLAVCFVLPDEDQNIKGYYTLSASGIPQNLVPEEIRKKLPRSYSQLPCTLLGRLAVDQKYAGQGLGKALLIDALKRSLKVSQSEIGSLAVIVDPLDESAQKYYKKYGFIHLPESGKMFLAMKTIAALF